MKIGVLAFQGDVIEHLQALKILGVETLEVRSVAELDHVDGLIIPGGESTVISKFLAETGVGDRIIKKHQNEKLPIYGTCAGAILLTKEIKDAGDVQSLGLMDITVERNAYGRQTESFEADIEVGGESVHGIFIRAPKIISTGNSVIVLASYEGSPVVCEEGKLLISTFHPELSDKPSALHRRFLEML
jgi:5'-phosphate synthase pdxT subunit